MTLSGKKALVTGASRGIGCAIAKLLAEQGVDVVGTATRDEGVAAINHYLSESGKGIKLDVSDSTNAVQQITQLNTELGGIDILVNNAGITSDSLLMRMSSQAWDRVLAINLSAIFHLSKAVIPFMMKKRYGRIINIGSVVASMGNSGQSNYAAAKAGLIGFSKALASEVAKRGITVNVVAPGFIETEMVSNLHASQRAAILDRVPLGRMGKTQEVAYAVAFLASPQAAYITGETLHINGGLYMA